MPKNITVSISDELIQKMDAMPEVNWSEVCRQAIERYTKKRGLTKYGCFNCGRTLELPIGEYVCKNCGSKMVRISKEIGELLKGLEDYLKRKLPKNEEKESIRRGEVERFTKKWGVADYTQTEGETPYVSLEKKQIIKHDDNTLAELRISSSRVLASRIIELNQKGLGKYNINAYNKNLEPLVDYFKSKGFTVAEDSLIKAQIEMYVTGLDKEAARDLLNRGYQYFGLFAADKEDLVFIGYRQVKTK